MASGTGQYADLLAPDLRKVWEEVGERPEEYSEYFNVIPMEWNPQREAVISGMGSMPAKDEGEQFTLDEPEPAGDIDIETEDFGLAFEVTHRMYRDDLYGIMKNQTANLRLAAQNRKEIVGWSLLNNGFSAAFPGYDGVSLFNAAHPAVDGTTQANRPAVDAAFGPAALQAALIRFARRVSERSLPMLIQPSLVVVDPANWFAVEETLGSTGRPYSADNEGNALVPRGLRWMVSHYLTTTTSWFLSAAKGVHRLNFYVRDELEFDSFDDPWTKNAIFTAFMSITAQHSGWREVDGTDGIP